MKLISSSGLFLLLSCCTLCAQDVPLKKQLVVLVQTYFSKGLLAKPYGSIELVQELKRGNAINGDTSVYRTIALQVATELFCGSAIQPWFVFDGVAATLHEKIIDNLKEQLSQINTPAQLAAFFDKVITPRSFSTQLLYKEYVRRFELARSYSTKAIQDTLSWLKQALSVHKWIDHFNLEKVVLIDLGTATLHYMEGKQPLYALKVIVGKPATPTPFFTAWASQLVLYPYWFVPRSIAVEEMLPKIKKDKLWLDRQNMQVFDKQGYPVNSDTINWKKYTALNFPYTLRQSTGCDNALGVLKIELSSPFGVYIHDTNNKAAFLRTNRFLSHGCIRVEEPFQLGNSLLSEKLDTTFLQSCVQEQKPVYKRFTMPIPIFSFYTLAHPLLDGQIIYTPDRYKIFTK
jgi:hypothetical protein